ncbi:hypothetical protein [Proteiniphilum sp.]|uniref:hypothetical protein n=1 Tax=Proteiniphilum sp. TaxID=1926877 RepID=UPI002B1F27FE|nr:hypothetical protein [Proteiniphilum sp.]MEA4917429.1 hypothetical protein [Proteiniphilum sp.]
MKRKLNLYSAGLLFLGFVFFSTSCNDDDIIETAWNIENFTVEASQWSWNPANRRWEAVRELDYIDEFIYEKGSVIGYVFLGEQNKDEVQTQLPYIKSYILDDGSKFTETISYEYSYLTNKVKFYIEPSDGIQDAAARQRYDFRIAMIW